MKFIAATTTEPKALYLNAEKIVSITPNKNGSVRICAGAGIYWDVTPETIIFASLEDVIREVSGTE